MTYVEQMAVVASRNMAETIVYGLAVWMVVSTGTPYGKGDHG